MNLFSLEDERSLQYVQTTPGAPLSGLLVSSLYETHERLLHLIICQTEKLSCLLVLEELSLDRFITETANEAANMEGLV